VGRRGTAWETVIQLMEKTANLRPREKETWGNLALRRRETISFSPSDLCQAGDPPRVLPRDRPSSGDGPYGFPSKRRKRIAWNKLGPRVSNLVPRTGGKCWPGEPETKGKGGERKARKTRSNSASSSTDCEGKLLPVSARKNQERFPPSQSRKKQLGSVGYKKGGGGGGLNGGGNHFVSLQKSCVCSTT